MSSRKIKAKFDSTCNATEIHKEPVSWKENDDIYYDFDHKQATCSNLECYKKKGGSPIEFPKGGGGFGKGSQQLWRDVTEGLDACQKFKETIIPMIKATAKETEAEFDNKEDGMKFWAEKFLEVSLGKMRAAA